MTNKLLKLSVVQEIVGVSRSTLLKWESEGILRPAYKTSGGHRRYFSTEVDQLIKKLTREYRDPASPPELTAKPDWFQIDNDGNQTPLGADTPDD